eukprot:gene2640-3406_t
MWHASAAEKCSLQRRSIYAAGRSTDDSEREHGTDEIRVNRRRFIGQAGSAKSEETTPPFATPSSAEALFSASEPRAAAAAGVPNYLEGGAFRPGRASRQKHTCTDCYPLCITAGCQLRINVTYPRNFLDGDAQHQYPFPLAVFTSGFLVPSEQYQSYADHLASWGYVVLTYDKVEGINSTLDDIVSSCLLRELIDWPEPAGPPTAAAGLLAGAPGRARLGWSRANAPVGMQPELPGARGALALRRAGGDCAPKDANYQKFFDAAPAPSWMVTLKDAGHFQFVDSRSTVQ